MTNAVATGSRASVQRVRVTVTMTANVPVAWSVAMKTVPGEIGTTAVRKVAQMTQRLSQTRGYQYHILSACFLPNNILHNTNIAEYNTTAGPNGEMNQGEVIRYVVKLMKFPLHIYPNLVNY